MHSGFDRLTDKRIPGWIFSNEILFSEKFPGDFAGDGDIHCIYKINETDRIIVYIRYDIMTKQYKMNSFVRNIKTKDMFSILSVNCKNHCPTVDERIQLLDVSLEKLKGIN